MSYKRNISRYSVKNKPKKISWQQIQRYKKAIKKYRKHPEKFIEDFYGIKLCKYQKMFLREINKNK